MYVVFITTWGEKEMIGSFKTLVSAKRFLKRRNFRYDDAFGSWDVFSEKLSLNAKIFKLVPKSRSRLLKKMPQNLKN